MDAHTEFRDFLNDMPAPTRLRWELKGAAQRLGIVSRAWRMGWLDYRRAVDRGDTARVVWMRDLINRLWAKRLECATGVSELRFKRDRRAMSPFAASIFQIADYRSVR